MRSTLAIQELGKVAAQSGGDGVADRPEPYAFFAAQFGACDIEWRGVNISLYVDDHARDRRDSTKRGGLVSGLKVAEIRAW